MSPLALAVLLCSWQISSGRVHATDLADPLPRPGVVFVVGGIGGMDMLRLSADWALKQAGVAHEVRDFDWTHGKGRFLRDLQDIKHVAQKAADLAAEVMHIKEQHPERPVFLVGKSGGAGLVLAAAELLPPGTLQRIILLSAAVSPHYDLRPALRATRGEIVSFYSSWDWVILGWGTSQFGTIDRVYGDSAGLTGFIKPTGADAETEGLYQRLVQVRWKPGMFWEGNCGGHQGNSMPLFVGREVAPWLKQ